MILKHAQGSTDAIAELERLRNMVPQNGHSAIDNRIARLRKGDAGERTVAHFLDREFGASDRMAILHDLRLDVDGGTAQIDHLVIHRVQQAAWILETKNYSGNLSCDEHGDWTLWYGRKPIPVPSPVNQARRQAILLERWLEREKITTIRSITPVVLISPKCSINRKHLSNDAHVVKSDNFGEWWAKQAAGIGIARALPMFGRHLVNSMSIEDMAELGRRLSEAHVPTVRDFRVELGIPANTEPESREVSSGPRLTEDAFPQTIHTVHGSITISRLRDGRLALRNEPKDDLIQLVRAACKGKARWNPRFKNWTFDAERFDEIRAAIANIS